MSDPVIVDVPPPRQQQKKRDKRDVHGWIVLDKPGATCSTKARKSQ